MEKGFCFQLMIQVLNSLQDGSLGDFNVFPLDLSLLGMLRCVDWYTVTNEMKNGKDIIFIFKQSKKKGSTMRCVSSSLHPTNTEY